MAVGAGILDGGDGGRHTGSHLFASTASGPGDRAAWCAADSRQLLRARNMGLERRHVRLAGGILGPGAARLRLDSGSLSVDAWWLHLHPRLLGPGRSTTRRV